MAVTRCGWGEHPLMMEYHDKEWGVPVHDDRTLFEFLVLEGAQSGLSWITILLRRQGYRRAFDNFDPVVVSQYGPEKIEALLQDPGIIRNPKKVKAAVTNARAFLRVQEEFGSFDRYIWQFVGGEPKVNHWQEMADVPATTPESIAMSKDMKRRGFAFVGPTVCYAYMQATGMVNDHLVGCFRHAALTPHVAQVSQQ